MELPTIQTLASGATSGSQEFVGSPTYRRQHRKQGSTVFVAPREDGPQQAPKVPLNAVVKGVGALAGAQALAKLVNFVLNQMLLRVVSSADVGQSNQMELFAATALSLTRDAVRFASVRETLYTKAEDRYHTRSEPVHGTQSGTLQETVNMGFVPMALGVPIVGLLLLFCWYRAEDPMLRASSAIWALAIVIELTAEPCFLLHQLKMNMALRARVESFAAVLRCVGTLAFVLGGQSRMLAFAIGQLAYALGMCIGYYVACIKEWGHAPFKLYLSPVWDEDLNQQMWLSPKISALAKGMYLQSVFKYLLTESDRILVSFFLSLEGQGEYAVAANYGSLVARMLLFPIEEALRTLFAKTLKSNQSQKPETEHQPEVPPHAAPLSPIPSASPPPPMSPHLGNDLLTRSRSLSVRSGRSRSSSLVSPAVPMPKQKMEKVSDKKTALTALTTVLRLYTFLGVCAVSIGPYVAPFGLRLLLSGSWKSSQAPQVLAAYVCYIPVLAWNGSLEAFIQSVASIDDLKRQARVMSGLAVCFLVAAYLFMRVFELGAVGLVYSQILSMGLRALWSLQFVVSYFGDRAWLAQVLPNRVALAGYAVALCAAHAVGAISDLRHLALHALLALVLAGSFGYSERANLVSFWKKRNL